jgi:hypothetical protein
MVPYANSIPRGHPYDSGALESAVFADVPGRHGHRYHDLMSFESFLSSAAGTLVSARNG